VKNGVLMRSEESRIGGYTSVNDAFPGGILADEILTPGDRQVRALFVTGGNPLVTMANAGPHAGGVREARAAGHARYLPQRDRLPRALHLPCTTPLERPDLPFIFPLMLGLQSRPYLQATEPVVRAAGEQRDEASIYVDLARASGVNLFGSRVAQKAMEVAMRLYSTAHPASRPPFRNDCCSRSSCAPRATAASSDSSRIRTACRGRRTRPTTSSANASSPRTVRSTSHRRRCWRRPRSSTPTSPTSRRRAARSS
jgi:hypothetical protein